MDATRVVAGVEMSCWRQATAPWLMQPAWLQVLKYGPVHQRIAPLQMQPAWLQVLKYHLPGLGRYYDEMQSAWLQVLKYQRQIPAVCGDATRVVAGVEIIKRIVTMGDATRVVAGVEMKLYFLMRQRR